jgi:two-component sensor histidine kinase
VIGSLILSTDRVEGFSEENIEVAREVVNSLALAIQQAQLLEQTRRDAETKTTLLREVNHRVKNNLVAIMGMLSAEKRRAKRDEFPDLTAILDGLSRRVEGLSILHHLLSDSEWKPLLLCELTERIIQAVMRGSPARGQVRIEVQRALLLVTPAVANHFALVVNELATNVLKHALPTREKILVDVRIAARGDDVHFEFCDNGPGFPDEALLRQANPSSLGFDLIRRVVTGNLNGSLRMRNDGGARTEIRFRNEIWKEAI